MHGAQFAADDRNGPVLPAVTRANWCSTWPR